MLGSRTGCDPAETLPTVETILGEAGVSVDRTAAVKHCIVVRGEDPQLETLEAEILRDADNLEVENRLLRWEIAALRRRLEQAEQRIDNYERRLAAARENETGESSRRFGTVFFWRSETDDAG